MNTLDWILTHGDSFLFWALTLVAGLASAWLVAQVKNGTAQGILRRALSEVGDAVLMVAKTYVEALKAAAADGKLTEQEKAEAKAKALKVAKANIGKAGLERLARILGADVDLDQWLLTKIESAVASKPPALDAIASPIEAHATPAGPTGPATPDPR